MHRDDQSSIERLPRRFVRRAHGDLPPAVVVGTDVTGFTVAKALARRGVPVLGIDEERRSYVSYSSAFDFLLCSNFYDVGLIRLLEQVADALPQKAVLILSMDEHVKLIGRYGQHLKERFHFDIPTPEVVDLLINKQLFTEYALANDLPLPRTACCETTADVAQAAATLEFPLILKPRLKNLESRAHAPKKAYVCHSPEELLAAYAVSAQWEKEVLVQEWIPGGDGDIHFSFHYFDASGHEVTSFEGRKIRQFIPECGVTASAVGVPTPLVSDISRGILGDVACTGFCSVEYKRDPRTGRFYIIEPTVGRVDLQLGVAMANDVDIVSRAYFHLIGRPYPVRERPTHHVKWIRGRADLQAARFYVNRGDISWRDYRRSVAGPRRFAVWGTPDAGLVLGWFWVKALWLARLPFRAARKAVRVLTPAPVRG
ncbi:MAG: carboxylate--amine ligase [Gemmatimonadaceae bacterium]